ncbi:site-specific DNA-methyltransferase [Brevibacillus composti]|uniref:Site-specific DNA-methyltransferase n=1 Tax=Brevibacillus composti TaxID=2796470 RepID=A0A7T5JNS3_9BACL|nr:site-specific DNA-methyltransferase [Brevibacillus composti]QQE74416.1 site-specific DNA-methyltransferase [Brevibacillus composti]QUO41498.1 site-specific DNA-methyltransferase [Brevibacillus composti]
MNKLTMKSVDLTQANIDKIAELFPNVITEARDEQGKIKRAVDFDLLKQELSDFIVEGEKERFQLTWPGKKEAILNANTPIDKTLRPILQDSVDWDNTQNIYIEGDNLEVLKLLQESYLNKIKCIYIDPPYNTGKDFVYKDDFKASSNEYLEDSGQIDVEGNRLFQNTESNGRFHSDWLTMMYSRLKLARNLLREDGVIFISIDDNELDHLRMICDNVFSGNFVAQITTLCNPKGRSQDKYFATNHEYILVYSKSPLPKGYFAIEKDQDQIEDEYPEQDELGRYRTLELRNTHREFGKHNRKNLFYPFYVNPVTSEVSLEYIDGYVTVEPIWDDGFEGCWTWDRTKAANDIHLLVAKQNPNGLWKIYRKSYAEGATKMLKTIFNDKLFYTEKGQAAFSSLFNERAKLFQSPKSVDLIKTILNTVTTSNDIILDFFSGSATTAHAVMELNAEDLKNRKYIMVQIPALTDEDSDAYKAGFKTICEIGKERIRRAAKKIKEETKAEIDYGFRVYRVDSSNMKDVYYTPDKLGQMNLDDLTSNIKEDRTGEDLLIQVMLECGLELSLPMETKEIEGKTVHYVAGNSLIACFDEELPESVIKKIATDQPLRVVFRDSSFRDDSARINVEELFKLLSPSTEIQVL